MTQKTIENEESNSFGELLQQTTRSLTSFNLSYEATPLPILQNVFFGQLDSSEELSNEWAYLQGDAMNLKDLPTESCQTVPYQMSLPLEIPSGQQNTTVLQLLKPYMTSNT